MKKRHLEERILLMSQIWCLCKRSFQQKLVHRRNNELKRLSTHLMPHLGSVMGKFMWLWVQLFHVQQTMQKNAGFANSIVFIHIIKSLSETDLSRQEQVHLQQGGCKFIHTLSQVLMGLWYLFLSISQTALIHNPHFSANLRPLRALISHAQAAITRSHISVGDFVQR